MNIRDAIKQILSKDMPPQPIRAKVTKVDKDKMLCDVEPINGDAEILDVKLSPDETQDYGFLPIPKEGSTVMVVFEDKNEAFVSLVAEVESYLIKIDSITLFIDANGMELNGNQHGGLTITPVLRTELNKTVARMTASEIAIVAFTAQMISIATSVPLFAPLIPGWTALAGSYAALPLNGAYNTNIESTKVNHGSN